jgi:hypothetical protein
MDSGQSYRTIRNVDTQHTSRKDTINAGGPRSLYPLRSSHLSPSFPIPPKELSLAAATPCCSPPDTQPRRSPAPHPLDAGQPIPSAPFLAPPPSPRGRRPGHLAGAGPRRPEQGAAAAGRPHASADQPQPAGSSRPGIPVPLPASTHQPWATAQAAAASSDGGPPPRRHGRRPHLSTVRF